MTKHYGAPSLTGEPTTFINCTDESDRRNGSNVNIIRRLDAPGDSGMHHDVPASAFPLYTVVSLDGSGAMWDAEPGDLHGAREGLILCPRCDVHEIPEHSAPGLTRTGGGRVICNPCERQEAIEDMHGELHPQAEWPLPRYATR
jgi:hypothetical protein